MRSRSGSFVFLILNVMVSAAVAFGVITAVSNNSEGGVREVPVRFDVIITATRDPNAGPQVIIITATPRPGEITSLQIPEDVREGSAPVDSGPIPTLDPATLDENGQPIGQGEALPAGCVEYAVVEGDNISSIAAEFEVSMNTMLAVNNLDDESARGLQIGQTLIVPLEGCPVERFIAPSVAAASTGEAEAETGPEVTDEPTGTPEATATPRPTVTLAPTAVNAQIELEIIGAGDITTEEVTITNRGNTVDISGWTLSDGEGNSFTFPNERRLFSQAIISVRTRTGGNTAILLHWGRDQAVFGQPGDVIVLRDASGVVQANIRLP